MFNQIFSTIQGFFSRSFWFGSFLPVAIAAALHLALVELAFPGLVPLETWLRADAGDKASAAGLLFAGLIILAYALAPFTPMVRGILDGRALPDGLHDRLRLARLPAWRKANELAADATTNFGHLKALEKTGITRLHNPPAPGRVADLDPAQTAALSKLMRQLVPMAEILVQEIETKMATPNLPRQEIERAVEALEIALPMEAMLDDDALGKLHAARAKLISLMIEAAAEAEYRLRRAPPRLDRTDLQATRVGDARHFIECYSTNAYGVGFGYLWTRIQMVLPAGSGNEGFLTRLTDAQAQVSFAVLTLGLTLTVPLVWLPLLLAVAAPWWLFLAVAVLSPAVLAFLYELVVQSQSVFGELVRGAIDRYRLDVLTKIAHQPLPQTLSTERALWRALRAAGEPGDGVDLLFDHADAA